MNGSDAIRGMLETRGTTQSKLANDMGVTSQTVNMFINGQSVNGEKKPISITLDTAVDIAAALGYVVAFVPTDKLPKGAFAVDKRTAPRRKRGANK